MKKILFYVTDIVLAAFVLSCADTPMVSIGIDDSYYVYRMKKLLLQPALTGESYTWSVRLEDGTDSVVSREKDYMFIAPSEGHYDMTFNIIDESSPYTHHFTIDVMREEVEYSPYISQVYEYNPAPGQFVNVTPLYEDGDTEKDILEKVNNCITGTNNILVSLGTFGGNITFGFDHSVMNRPGNDFMLLGNAFYTNIPEYADNFGGSAEPGIVMVSTDTNMNGLPDDDWYELAGSEYNNPQTIHNYEVTYYYPDGHTPEPDDSGLILDKKYIKWVDNQGNSGYVMKNHFHGEDYFPMWKDYKTMTFRGSRLPDNARDESGMGSFWVQYAFDWGYADNHPNNKRDLNSFDISNAVDAQGRHVTLKAIDFVRVYTGQLQNCGQLGETSTEICHGRDLNISDTK